MLNKKKSTGEYLWKQRLTDNLHEVAASISKFSKNIALDSSLLSYKWGMSKTQNHSSIHLLSRRSRFPCFTNIIKYDRYDTVLWFNNKISTKVEQEVKIYNWTAGDSITVELRSKDTKSPEPIASYPSVRLLWY